MKVLIVGSGGREHALAYKISKSNLVKKLYAAPGNAGISQLAHCVDIAVSDIAGLADFAWQERIDLTVVGPELPLVMGVVDEFQKRGLKIVGPTRRAARLEASKAYAKELLRRRAVPTADFAVFSSAQQACEHLKKRDFPAVIKADGLAAGKGVTIAHNLREAEKAVAEAMIQGKFGLAGSTIVIEDCLCGEEASFIALVDAETIVPLASSQDHKPLLDGDKGPNTGGMGAYSPAPVISPTLSGRIIKEIIEPTIQGLREEGVIYRGVIYAGLMVVEDNPLLLEFNVRFGDPETQPVLVRLRGDLVPLLLALTEDNLKQFQPEWDERSSVCVVMVSAGYPESYEKGKVITGLQEAASLPDIQIFHAGTKLSEQGLVTDGGRVLGVTGLGHTLKNAVDVTYAAVKKIHWDGAYFRKDIAWRGLAWKRQKASP